MAVVEAILLIGFSIPLWADRVERLPAAGGRDAACAWSAEQFAWNIHYPGPDGVFGRTDVKLIDAAVEPARARPRRPGGEGRRHHVNQLHLPVDKPVLDPRSAART